MFNIFKSPKFLIFLIVFVNFLGYGIVFPILPLMTEKYGGNPLESGILIAAFSIMQVIAMPILGRLSDKYGRRPLLIYSLWGTVASFAIMGITHSIFWLLVARVIDGISGGNISIAQAYAADITDRKHRAGGMGIIAAGISLGFIFGPLWGGLFSQISLGAPFFAAAALTLGSIILTQFFLPETVSTEEKTYEKSHFSFITLLTEMENPTLLLMFFTYLLFFWAQSGVFTTLSLLGKDVFRLDVLHVSFIFAFGGILAAFIQGFAINKTVSIIPEEKLYIISAFASTLGYLTMSQGKNIILFFIGITIFSIGNAFLAPSVQALASEGVSQHEQGGAMGLLQSFGSIGRILGPVIAGFIYETYGPFTPEIMGTVLFAFILILGFLTFRKSFSRS